MTLAIVVPVKSPHRAKLRLEPILSEADRERLARVMARDVFKAVSEKQPQHMAWAYDRADGGRGFGFSGMHAHANWAVDGFRQTLVNGLAWVAKLEVPAKGVGLDWCKAGSKVIHTKGSR